MQLYVATEYSKMSWVSRFKRDVDNMLHFPARDTFVEALCILPFLLEEAEFLSLKLLAWCCWS